MLSIALPCVNKPNHLTGLGTMVFINDDFSILVVNSLHFMKKLFGSGLSKKAGNRNGKCGFARGLGNY